MKNHFASALTTVQNKDHERARLKQIALKWAKISRERAKDDFLDDDFLDGDAARDSASATRAS